MSTPTPFPSALVNSGLIVVDVRDPLNVVAYVMAGSLPLPDGDTLVATIFYDEPGTHRIHRYKGWPVNVGERGWWTIGGEAKVIPLKDILDTEKQRGLWREALEAWKAYREEEELDAQKDLEAWAKSPSG